MSGRVLWRCRTLIEFSKKKYFFLVQNRVCFLSFFSPKNGSFQLFFFPFQASSPFVLLLLQLGTTVRIQFFRLPLTAAAEVLVWGERRGRRKHSSWQIGQFCLQMERNPFLSILKNDHGFWHLRRRRKRRRRKKTITEEFHFLFPSLFFSFL